MPGINWRLWADGIGKRELHSYEWRRCCWSEDTAVLIAELAEGDARREEIAGRMRAVWARRKVEALA